MSKNLKLTALILSAVMAVSCIPANIFSGNAEVLKISDTEVRPLEDFTEELQQYPEYYISGSLTKTTDRSYSYDSAGRLTDTENVSTIEGTITKLKDQYGNVVQSLNQELDPTLYKFTEGAYTYNGAGQRVKKEVVMRDGNNNPLPAVTRKYFYTGDCVLFVADASNNKTIENVLDLSGSILLSQRFELTPNGNVENGWYFFNTDIRGSITSILREDLSFATGYVYDEYGNQIKTGEKDFLNEATYTGAIYDEESDLYFLNARYYDSNTGQFISRDTYLGDAYSPWTQNLYSYTGGNPVNYTDPTGHIALAVIALIAGAIIGGAIGAYKSYKDTGSVSAGSVVKGALIGGGVGFLAGAGAAILATGAAMATTAEVVAGVKTIVAAGSLSASIGLMGENVKTFVGNLSGSTATQITENQRKMNYVRETGKKGEDFVTRLINQPKNTERIYFKNAAGKDYYRIPDLYNKFEHMMGEIKNVKRISLTPQLKDFIAYCEANDFKFTLYVGAGDGTYVSKALLREIFRIGGEVVRCIK